MRTCSHCGERYKAERLRGPRGYCSSRCRTAAHRATKVSAEDHMLTMTPGSAPGRPPGREHTHWICSKCGGTWTRYPRGGCQATRLEIVDPRKCRACGHIRIAKDADGREVDGGAHVNNTGLCWFCWLETPEGAERKAALAEA